MICFICHLPIIDTYYKCMFCDTYFDFLCLEIEMLHNDTLSSFKNHCLSCNNKQFGNTDFINMISNHYWKCYNYHLIDLNKESNYEKFIKQKLQNSVDRELILNTEKNRIACDFDFFIKKRNELDSEINNVKSQIDDFEFSSQKIIDSNFHKPDFNQVIVDKIKLLKYDNQKFPHINVQIPDIELINVEHKQISYFKEGDNFQINL